VIDLRTLAPLDKPAILASVRKTNRTIVLHEASRTGGIGGEIAATIAEEAFEWLDAPVLRVASIDTPCRIHRRLRITIYRRRKMFWMRRGDWLLIESGKTEVRGQRTDVRSEI